MEKKGKPEIPKRLSLEMLAKGGGLYREDRPRLLKSLKELADEQDEINEVLARLSPLLMGQELGQPTRIPVDEWNILEDSIREEFIKDWAVTTEKIKDAAIVTNKIADFAVVNAKIGNAAITNAKIDDLAVSSAKIEDLAVLEGKIANLAVGTAKIADLAVGTAKVQDAAIESAKIKDLAVTEAKIATLAVGSAKIQDAAITNAKIDNLAVTEAKIGALAVTSAKIASTIQSDNYVEDQAGWFINKDGKCEFGDVKVRGEIRASAFKYNTISAVGGKLIMSEATPLIADVAAAGTSIDVADQAFQTNDLVHLKDVYGGTVQEEWMRVLDNGTAITGGFRYTVTRNLDGSGANDWKKGTAVVEKGYSDGVSSYGGAWIELAGDEAGGELLQSFKRTGVDYNAYTEQVWIDADGKLKAGGGNVILDAGGQRILASIGGPEGAERAIKWEDTAGKTRGLIEATASATSENTQFVMQLGKTDGSLAGGLALKQAGLRAEILYLSLVLTDAVTEAEIWKDASGNLTFKDAVAGEKTLDYLAKGECAHVYHNAAQTTTTGVWLTLAFNSEAFDTDDIHDNVTNNSRLTCKTAGKYIAVLGVQFAANTTGSRVAAIILNGDLRAQVAAPAVATTDWSTNIVVTLPPTDMAVNDYLEARVIQNSGGNLDILYTGALSPRFSMIRVG